MTDIKMRKALGIGSLTSEGSMVCLSGDGLLGVGNLEGSMIGSSMMFLREAVSMSKTVP